MNNKPANTAKQKTNLDVVAKAISEKLAKKDYKVIKLGRLEQEFASK